MYREKSGFTLVELLVVIVIITVLAALVLPAVSRSMQQARRRQVEAEMRMLAAVVTQVYSDIGYYVRLEDLVESNPDNVRRWGNVDSDNDYQHNGRSDDDLSVTLADSAHGNRDVSGFWSGPYTTFQHYLRDDPPAPPGPPRPLDAWGRGEDYDVARFHQYRMFWFSPPVGDPRRAHVPAGASGTMVIISPGPDGRYQSGIDSRADSAGEAEFAGFDPLGSGDDIFFTFNAGIQ